MQGLTSAFRRLLSGAIFRQGGVVLLDQGLLSLTNFLTGVLVARACTTEEYGMYVLIWSVLMIVLSLYKALVHIPFTVFLPRFTAEEGNRFQGSALVQTLLIAGLAAAAVFLLARLGTVTGVADLAYLLPVAPLVALLLFPFLLREFARNALFSRLQFRASVVVSVLATTGQLLAVSGLFLTGRLSLAAALWIILATSVFAGGLMLWLHRVQMTVTLGHVWADFRAGWHVSRWSLVNVFGMIGTSQAYPWLLLGLGSASDVAIYGAAAAMAGVMAPFLQAANAYVLPRMAHGFAGGDVATLRRMLRRAMAGLLIPFGLWVVVGGIWADEIMTLLYSDRYAGAGTVVLLLLLRSLVEGVSAPMNPALQALEQNQVTTQALLLGSAVTFTAGYWAIGRFGLAGAAAAALAVTVVVAGYRYWRLTRLLAARL